MNKLRPATRMDQWFHGIAARVSRGAGGSARLRVIVLLACVLGLEAADAATVGAVAAPLKASLHISNTDIGLLVTVTTAMGVVATLPVGVLVDRVNRTRVIAASILLWSAAELLGGLAQSYLWLLLSRLALCAVVATSAPAVASLVGDYFRVSERGRIYGYVLTGELGGAGVGILVSGDLGALTWRLSFAWLVTPGLALAAAIWRLLPEPSRGDGSRMVPGAMVIPAAQAVNQGEVLEGTVEDDDTARRKPDAVRQGIAGRGVAPRNHRVLHEDPTGRGIWWAVRYVLSVPTNRLLIVASALGYFYFEGLRTFAVPYLRGRFGLGQAAASSTLLIVGIGAVAGVWVAGRMADRLVTGGRVTARVAVAAVAVLLSVVLLGAGLLMSALTAAVALFFVGVAAVAGSNPPIDAARLDVMHSRLWGRAESVRTLLRSAFEAMAPLLFGLVSAQFGGQGGLGNAAGDNGGGIRLQITFLIMLVALAAAGGVLLLARRPYPRDVATAMASESATSEADTGGDETT